MNIFDECSQKELRILEFFAKSYEEDPQNLKKYLLDTSLSERARVLAFLQIRVPKLYNEINNLLETD